MNPNSVAVEVGNINWYPYEPRYNIGDICLSYPLLDGIHRIQRYVMVTECYFDTNKGMHMYSYLDLSNDGLVWSDSTAGFEYRYGFVS